jgi:hypothetical protein
MKYLVTLIETTVHTVEVEAKDKVRAGISAEDGWCNGWLVDDNPHLVDLMVSEVIEIPMEDVA